MMQCQLATTCSQADRPPLIENVATVLFARALQVLFIATPLLCWCLNASLGKRRIQWPPLFVLTGVIGYVLLLASVQALDHALLADLYTHDLDGDRSFSESELTEEAQRAMNRVSNDTGRALAPATGLPITFIWTLLNFALLGYVESTGRWLISKLSPPRTVEDASVSETNAFIPDATQNPYHPPASS